MLQTFLLQRATRPQTGLRLRNAGTGGTNVFAAKRGSISVNAPVSFQPLWDEPRFQALLADPRNNERLF